MPARALSPAEQLLMLRRRKWWFLLPAAAVLAATVAVTLAWPPTYRSTATILIEEAEMPEDLQG
ncbi:Wzz/FepE/Etk N-terminal domain-containing protein, partial [Shewanella sp. C32]